MAIVRIALERLLHQESEAVEAAWKWFIDHGYAEARK
jgi:hypothetical protein